MIEDIEINNFRCFDRLKVSRCKRVNLISGKNNVGKTALLEAIFLSSMPSKDTIISLGDLRKELFISGKESSEKMWGKLFYQQNIDSYSCSMNLVFNDNTFKKIEIFVGEKQSFIAQLFARISSKSSVLHDEWMSNFREKAQFKDEQYIAIMLINQNSKIIHKLIGLSSNYEINVEDAIGKYADMYQNTLFIPSTLRASGAKLTAEFDQSRLDDRDDAVLKAFQIIDSSIISVESFSIPEPTIYLKRQGEKRLPLSLFGDAMNRIAEIILKIINNQDSILLIDEIENGIHHSSQIAFWDFLYKLADQLNVQIFATTHSLEMTEAFIKAGLDRADSAAHFELTRNEKTNKIVAINRDLETLEYGISHHKEVRGGA